MGIQLPDGSIDRPGIFPQPMQDQMYRPPGYLAADPNAVAGPSEYTLQQYAQPYAAQPVAQQYAPQQMSADPGAINDSTVNAALAVLNRAPISRPMPAMRGSGAIGQPDQTPYEDYLRTWGNIAPEVSTATRVNQTPAYSGGDSGGFDFGGGSSGGGRSSPAPVVNMSTPYNPNPSVVPGVPAPIVSSYTSPGSGVGGGYNAGDGGYGSGEVGYDAGDMAHGDGGGSGAGGYDAGDGGYGSGEAGYDAGDMGHGDGGGGGGGKIICTAMNHAYGFGSFRNAIWIKYADKHLTKAHEVGYHTLFLPLVDFGFKRGDGKLNLIVRKVLEWGTRHRSTDLRAELRNKKRDTTGRIIRLIFEPLCYAVGKLKGY